MTVSHGKESPLFVPEAVNAPQEGGLFIKHCRQEHTAFQLYRPSSGKSWWLKSGENTVGRSFDNDVVLTDLSVSRHHAKIYVDGQQIYIRDRGSRNGLFLAGQKVKDSILHLDCIFTIGKVEVAIIRAAANDDGRQAWMP